MENKKKIIELLEQIAKGSGAYSRDQHEHANNVITESIENAKEALKLLKLEDSPNNTP